MWFRSVLVGAIVLTLWTVLEHATASSGTSNHEATRASNGPTTSAKGTSGPTLSPAQLDQLLAPIDLYPDGLLWQIFLAATHPQDVVEAARWVRDPEHADLQGEELAKAIQALPWDPNVKALASLPSVLQMMSEHIDWTQRLGTAFIAQRSELLDAVQRLRRQARAAGTFDWNPNQTANATGETITNQSANADVGHVQEYDPATAFGTWPYSDFLPFSFSAVVNGRSARKANAEPRLPESTEAEDFHRLSTGALVAVPRRPGNAMPGSLPETVPDHIRRLPTGELVSIAHPAGKQDGLRSSPRAAMHGPGTGHVVVPSSAPAAVPKIFNSAPIVHAPAAGSRPQTAPRPSRLTGRRP